MYTLFFLIFILLICSFSFSIITGGDGGGGGDVGSGGFAGIGGNNVATKRFYNNSFDYSIAPQLFRDFISNLLVI
jgi:hypothetical protein